MKSAMQVASGDASSGQLHFGPIGFVIYAVGRERRVHQINMAALDVPLLRCWTG